MGGPMGRPELISIFEDGDSLFLASDTLISRQLDAAGLDTSRILSAYHNVRFFKSDFQGLSDSMVYNTRDSLFRLFGNPLLWSDSTQFKADSISIHLANDEIDRVVLVNDAIIINQVDGIFYNQIKGKVITAYFKEGAVDRLKVEGNAETIYYAKDDSGAYLGVDQSVCSKMMVYFKENEVQQIKFYKEPTSSLIPMTEADHDNLRLKGFEWLIHRKPQNRLDIFAVTNKTNLEYEN
jgi:lipopolysaccharide export system protein LptA